MENVKCRICRKSFSTLVTHINRIHGISKSDYLKRYPNSLLISNELRTKQRQGAKQRFASDPVLRYLVSSRAFDFVRNKKLASLLQRDLKSAKFCLANSLWKPSVILYGSIIEAVLIEKYPKLDYYTVINTAFKNGMITEIEHHEIHIIRDLRNFVHVHKELLGVDKINEHWAKTAADICTTLIRRLNHKFRNDLSDIMN